MAVARAQGQSGISAIHIWLIVMVALWLTSTVLLVILYLNQEDLKTENETLRQDTAKLASGQDRNLPQFSEARPDRSLASLLEGARARTAELAVGKTDADAATIQTQLDEKLNLLRSKLGASVLGDVDSFAAALDAVIKQYDSAVSARNEAVTSSEELNVQVESLREQVRQKEEEFAKGAEELKDKLAKLDQDRETISERRDEEATKFERDLETLSDRASGDIQRIRAEKDRIADAYNELLERYQQLQKKLGQFQVSPVEMATARQADGQILTAKSGEDVVYINLGRNDHLTLGLEFAVYDSLTGIPADGRAKARIEVVNIRPDTAECRVVDIMGQDLVLPGDLIANPVYDPARTLKFYVLGRFDLNGDGRPDADGDDRIKALVTAWGGEIENDLTAQVDFVVMGGPPAGPPQSLLERGRDDDPVVVAAREAQEKYQERVNTVEVLAIPTLTQSVFLNFLGYDRGMPLVLMGALAP